MNTTVVTSLPHRYNCKVCKKGYDVYSSYYSHCKGHRANTVSCVCGLTFKVKSQLYHHAYHTKCGARRTEAPIPQSLPSPPEPSRAFGFVFADNM